MNGKACSAREWAVRLGRLMMATELFRQAGKSEQQMSLISGNEELWNRLKQGVKESCEVITGFHRDPHSAKGG